jgi:hypothetical protein
MLPWEISPHPTADNKECVAVQMERMVPIVQIVDGKVDCLHLFGVDGEL